MRRGATGTSGVCDLKAAHGLDLGRWMPDGAGPGLVAGVLAGGAVASWTGAGRVTLGGAERVGPRTVFYVASLAKQFTAACVTACENDGLLEVDGSIRTLVPELPEPFAPISLRHLLHHLGGLPHGGAAGLSASTSRDTDWREGLGLWDMINLLGQEPRLRRPGEAYAYSNCGYWLLAAAVERAAGEPFAAFARRRLFVPLGMNDTRFRDAPDALQPGLAPGHARRDGGYVQRFTRFHGVGDGGLLTTVEDLAKWDTFWTGASSLGDELLPRMLEQGRRDDGALLSYARGVSVGLHRGIPARSHTGGFLGYRSVLVHFPEQAFSICALSNADDVDLVGLSVDLADRALGSLMDKELPPWAEHLRHDGLAV